MHDALADLRRTRRAHRLGDLEWFDLAYRVYLAAIFGGGAVLVLSDYVGDAELEASEVARAVEHGPAVLGLAAALALMLGLRSGADGGPVSVEPADVRHLLLAPVPRRHVLLRPLVQRLRSAAFVGAIVGAIAGQLAAQRLPGSPAAWAASGALAAAIVGVLFVAAAGIAHALAIPRPLATVGGVAVVAWQVGAVVGDVPGPGDAFGRLAMWGMQQQATDLTAVAVTALLAVVATALVGRLRIEPLVTRGELVSQLRFAVTMQDLRTVVLLRRQLRNERARQRPWLRIGWRGGAVGPPPWWRSVRGILRTPMSRFVRMAALMAAAGLATVAVLRGTTPALVLIAVTLFLFGLDAIEPLSQEIDHPELTDGLPWVRGRLHVGLLAGPVVLAVGMAAIGVAVVVAFEPDALAGALALAIPVILLGMSGAVVNTVRDAPVPAASESSVMPPEFAGFNNVMRLLLPLVVSATASLPVLAMRAEPTVATALRAVIGSALFLAAFAWWVYSRDAVRASVRSFMAGART